MRSFISKFLLCSAAIGGLCAVPSAAGITPAELSARLSHHDNVLIVDVRPAIAFTAGHIPGAINIPLSLLPYKHLPHAQLVVICGDGLGVVDDADAQRAAKVNAGVAVDTLAGGYAGWLSDTRISTEPAGVSRQQFPAITYDRLVSGNHPDVTIVDLTTPSTGSGKTAALAAASPSGSLVASFAAKIGAPVFRTPVKTGPRVAAMSVAPSSTAVGPTVSSPHLTLDSLDHSGRLLVLVGDNEAAANAAARDLRSRGNYRFTILIGGTEAIRYEGKTGSGRLTGNVSAQSQP